MTPLLPGTALHNGHYVLDALLAVAPDGDLYWGTHVVSGTPVYIQVMPLATSLEMSNLSASIARLEGLGFSPQSPLPNPLKIFQGEGSTLCLAMGTGIGLPWSHLCQILPPLTVRQALSTLRHIAHQLAWLAEQGLPEIEVSANRVWLGQDDRVYLSGVPTSLLATSAESEPLPLRALAQLLASFLLGEWPIPQTSESLMQHLQQRRPQLSPLILQAIAQGVSAPLEAASLAAIPAWLDTFPETGSSEHRITPVSPTESPLLVSAPQSPPARRFLYPALAGTALLAAIAGVALGTVWRLNAASLPGAIQFDPNQSFPPQSDWAGDSPTATFDSPYIPSQPTIPESWLESDWTPDSPIEDEWSLPADEDPATTPSDSPAPTGQTPTSRSSEVEELPAVNSLPEKPTSSPVPSEAPTQGSTAPDQATGESTAESSLPPPAPAPAPDQASETASPPDS